MGFIVVKHCNLTKCVSKKYFAITNLLLYFSDIYHSITSLDKNRQYSKSVRSVLKVTSAIKLFFVIK